MSVEVCPICDIAGCVHIRDRAKAARIAELEAQKGVLLLLCEDRFNEIAGLRLQLADARDKALEEAAELAAGFGWTLTMFADAKINAATDDAACEVQGQIAAAIRAMKGTKP